MTKNVIWFSRHDLTKEQIEGLKKIFKTEKVKVKVKTVNKTIQSAEEINDKVL